MKTEKLKQNVKGYVHQFEDGGLRLLRKGQKGVIHAIFSRFGLVLILLLAALGGGGAFAYIKFIKPKQGAKVSADPDDYEFEDEEYENEDIPEQGEQEEQN